MRVGQWGLGDGSGAEGTGLDGQDRRSRAHRQAGTPEVEPSRAETSRVEPSRYRNKPKAPSSDQLCQLIAGRPATEISAIIRFWPCSAQSWIISAR